MEPGPWPQKQVCLTSLQLRASVYLKDYFTSLVAEVFDMCLNNVWRTLKRKISNIHNLVILKFSVCVCVCVFLQIYNQAFGLSSFIMTSKSFHVFTPSTDFFMKQLKKCMGTTMMVAVPDIPKLLVICLTSLNSMLTGLYLKNSITKLQFEPL